MSSNVSSEMMRTMPPIINPKQIADLLSQIIPNNDLEHNSKDDINNDFKNDFEMASNMILK